MHWAIVFKIYTPSVEEDMKSVIPVELYVKSSRKNKNLLVQCEIVAEILWNILISSANPV